MEQINIQNKCSRLLLERTDNGIILYDVGDDNVVSSKVAYEIFYKDGVLDFENMAVFVYEIFENMKIPVIETESNRALGLTILKIDPDKPMLDDNGDEIDEDIDEDEDDD